jgi:cold shock CspA family protein
MRLEGIIKSWNDDRGFGFIEPTQGGQELFVHIKAFAPHVGRPLPNELVTFEVELGREGKKRAKNVEFMRQPRSLKSRRFNPAAQWGTASLLAIPAFLVLYLLVAVVWRVPKVVTAAYIVMSIVCFLVYFVDKQPPRRHGGARRKALFYYLGCLVGGPEVSWRSSSCVTSPSSLHSVLLFGVPSLPISVGLLR